MKQEIFSGSWKFAAAASRQSAWSLTDMRRNEDIAVFGFAKLNNRSEADALQEKCRFHGKLDNCEAVIESENVYPFGGESIIGRTITLRDKLLQTCVDIKPGKGEVVRNFELETLFFPGEFASSEIIAAFPEDNTSWQSQQLALDSEVLYSSTQPWVVLLLTDPDGFQIELGTGGDMWRMQGSGDTLWQIRKTSEGISVNCKLVALADDCEVQRRPWRFDYYLAWGRKTAVSAPADGDITLTPDLKKLAQSECFRAPAVRKVLRKLIRQQLEKSGNVALNLPDVTACSDAGHLERPGKKSLPHWSMDELFALYSWGNRALGFDRNLQIYLPENSIFRNYPAYRYLSSIPGETFIREQ